VRSDELSEPRLTLVDGSTVIVSYHVTMDSEWLPDYAAWMTAHHTWEGGDWSLAVRTHAPKAVFPF
jgi:hypothetical protein